MDFVLPSIASPSDALLAIMDEYTHQAAQPTVSSTEMRLLKTRWNAALPVSQLPPELLATIFKACVAAVKAEYYRLGSMHVKPYSWISISHVCQLWREVALQHPQLWCWIVKTSDEFTRLLLQRSGSAPLTIDTQRTRKPCASGSTGNKYQYVDWSPSALAAVYGHWYRVEEADVDQLGSEWTNVRAPLLRKLRVPRGDINYSVRDPPAPFVPDGLPSLEECLWDSGYGSLRTLQPFFGPKVKDLCIRLMMADPSFSVDSWVTVLQSMSSLRTLTLMGVVSHFIGPQTRSSQVASLPHLRKLTLGTISLWDPNVDRGDHAPEISLLASLDIPHDASTQFMILAPPPDTEIAALSAIMSNLANKFRADELALTIETDEEMCSWRHRKSIGTGESADEGEYPAVEVQARLSFPSRVVLQLSSAFSWSTVTTMRLRITQPPKLHDRHPWQSRMSFNPDYWRAIGTAALRNLVNLAVLVVEGREAAGVVFTILESPAGSTDAHPVEADPSPHVLPKLQDCMFEGVLWRKSDTGDLPSGLLACKNLVDPLCRTFSMRRTQGALLRVLRITTAADISMDDIRYMRAQNLADVVEWDAEQH
ncbi:hypothetical protein NM688_g5742 [Phlebia brevispora]|uniref:Uncharacterized protein n=1 Tax=Phlebia brevispora TaxID=194682 RepID=A0ACC1SQI5_9APHY|nr:hypothetical protein NM688_g5742 [Phlebia brevispora]